MNIVITGSSGFLGSHVLDKLSPSRHNLILPRSSRYDFRSQSVTEKFFQDNPKIDCMIHLAASCGGIGANMKNPGRYFYDNIAMGINLIEFSRIYDVKKFILIGTVCSYPKYCPVPFQESDIWNGYPEETNAPYGIAKKSLYVMLESYYHEYNMNSTTLIPSNLYGPKDNFNLESSHVIPAIITKIYHANKNKTNITLWGDGSATREFVFAADAALAIIKSIDVNTGPQPINIASNNEISIKNLVELIADKMNFTGEIIWDKSKPNGQPRRCVDSSLASSVLKWRHSTQLHDGIDETINFFYKYVA